MKEKNSAGTGEPSGEAPMLMMEWKRTGGGGRNGLAFPRSEFVWPAACNPPRCDGSAIQGRCVLAQDSHYKNHPDLPFSQREKITIRA